jgi:LAO/AO transport system kinase
MQSFLNQTTINGWKTAHRKQQDVHWLKEALKEMLVADFFENTDWLNKLIQAEQEVVNGKTTSYQAALSLYVDFKNKK